MTGPTTRLCHGPAPSLDAPAHAKRDAPHTALRSGQSFTKLAEKVDLSKLHARFAREEPFRRLKPRQLEQLSEEVRGPIVRRTSTHAHLCVSAGVRVAT